MFLPKKVKKEQARIEGDIENKCCSAIWVDPNLILNHNPIPIKDQILP